MLHHRADCKCQERIKGLIRRFPASENTTGIAGCAGRSAGAPKNLHLAQHFDLHVIAIGLVQVRPRASRSGGAHHASGKGNVAQRCVGDAPWGNEQIRCKTGDSWNERRDLHAAAMCPMQREWFGGI